MTGPWLIVKWAGITVLVLYVVLMLVAIWRFRANWSRIPDGFCSWTILFTFVWVMVPSHFENAIVTRLCFVVVVAIYIVGIVNVVTGLARGARSLIEAS